MYKRQIRIELLKYAEEDLRYRHFYTAIASSYQELLDKCNCELDQYVSWFSGTFWSMAQIDKET